MTEEGDSELPLQKALSEAVAHIKRSLEYLSQAEKRATEEKERLGDLKRLREATDKNISDFESFFGHDQLDEDIRSGSQISSLKTRVDGQRAEFDRLEKEVENEIAVAAADETGEPMESTVSTCNGKYGAIRSSTGQLTLDVFEFIKERADSLATSVERLKITLRRLVEEYSGKEGRISKIEVRLSQIKQNCEETYSPKSEATFPKRLRQLTKADGLLTKEKSRISSIVGGEKGKIFVDIAGRYEEGKSQLEVESELGEVYPSIKKKLRELIEDGLLDARIYW